MNGCTVKSEAYTVEEEDRDTAEIAAEWVSQGYRQISRSHRLIARLPENVTALEAIARLDPEMHRRMLELVEQRAADYYRRMYAKQEGNELALMADEFDAFRAAGGGT
jgi:hypothetical protein